MDLYLVAYFIDDDATEKSGTTETYQPYTIEFLEDKSVPVIKLSQKWIDYLFRKGFPFNEDISEDLFRLIDEEFVTAIERLGTDDASIFLDFVQGSQDANLKIKITKAIPR